jgi:FMN reductase
MRATVVVGNPKLGSRTAAAAVAVAESVLGAGGEVTLIELAELASGLFAWGGAEIADAKAAVLSSDLVVVASPVYKASITGLLKAFLDHFGRDELGARAVVPLMVGAAPIHALAVESQLRPVLIEIGASCPTRGLFIMESQIDSLAPLIDEWLTIWGGALRAVMNAKRAD